MADYYPLISRAIAALDSKSEEARRAVYDRARAALEDQFQKADPPLSETNVEIQRLALEDAINRVEADWVERKEAASSAEQTVRAHQARRDAQWANWIAVAAGIIAIAAVIIATIWLIVALSSRAV